MNILCSLYRGNPLFIATNYFIPTPQKKINVVVQDHQIVIIQQEAGVEQQPIERINRTLYK